MLRPLRGRNEAGQRPQSRRRALSDPWAFYHLARGEARGRGGGGDHRRRRPPGQRRMRPLRPLWRERGGRRRRRSRLARRPSRRGLDRAGLQALLPAGAARNALDCALWDLEAKISGRSAAELAGLAPLHAVETAFTISLGPPEEMAARAREAARYPLLKLKLGGDGDEARLAAIRARRAQGAAHRRCQ